ncbi:MAG: enoyl-CoA hydratase/isomerase family protein [Gammaproteobacteria bacterium]|nr:enoyl-CoA hydratase/isomerase family protein [Gammaproteobacteria bacterium]
MTNSYLQRVNHNNGIVQITLNRPEVHNAFDDKLIAELTHLLLELDKDKATKVIILDAKGKSFSAGADLNWMKRMAGYSREENYHDSLALADLMSALYTMHCPTIAAVQGTAFGGGVGLIACCDIAIASHRVNFCLSEVKLGLIPAVISPYVIKAIGERATKRYFITAEIFDADRALQLGLISELADPDALASKVMALAHKIVSNGPEAVKAAKELINSVIALQSDGDVQQLREKLHSMTATKIADIRASNQGKEGVTAFLEKRQANWDQD